jgi:hypothetical protein
VDLYSHSPIRRHDVVFQLLPQDKFTTSHQFLGFLSPYKTNKQEIGSVALSPQVNYTDRPTAACRRIIMPNFADTGMSPGQRGGPHGVSLSFLRRLIFIHDILLGVP